MSLPHILLGMLRYGPRSGYDLDKELKTVIHYFWETDLSRIYRTLAELRDQGQVEFETVVQTESPNKKVYSITETGRAELQRWLAEPGKPQAESARNPFLAQLHFSGAISVEAQRRVLERRLHALREEVVELEWRARAHKLPVPLPEDALSRGISRDTFSLEYGLSRYAFEIAWTENIVRVLSHDTQTTA
jgi:DNA-binding PadR family transcriptional regulator